LKTQLGLLAEVRFAWKGSPASRSVNQEQEAAKAEPDHESNHSNLIAKLDGPTIYNSVLRSTPAEDILRIPCSTFSACVRLRHAGREDYGSTDDDESACS
jgi:hypothetical protein